MPPRLFGKEFDGYLRLAEIYAPLERKMLRPNEQFDPQYLLSLLKKFDEAHSIIDIPAVERANRIVDQAWMYFRSFEPTADLWEKVRPFLKNPSKMVRIWIATEMLQARNREGWPVLIEELESTILDHDISAEQINRNFAARSHGYNFIMFNHKLLEELDVKPSLSEVEDRWIALGLSKRPFVRMP